MAAPKGVYKISSKINPLKIYIGSSDNIYRRWRVHKFELQNNKHHSIILQNHVNKYGLDDLLFEILLICNKDELTINEQKYIDNLNPKFNIRKVAESNVGIKRTIETKEKIRKANIGKKLSELTKEKMRKRMTGNHYTRGRIPVNARKLIDIKTNKIYNSIPIAAYELGIRPRTLRAMIDGQNRNKTNLRIAS